MADSTVIRGIVKATSDKYGGALTFGEQGPDGKDVWLAYSKPEYRELGFYEPKAGDNVEAIVSWAQSGKGYIKQCINLRNGGSQAQGAPPWEQEPPFEAYEVPERDVNADVAPRKRSTDESIQMQVAVKCATELMIALIEHGREDSGKTMAPTSIAAEVAAMASAIAVVYSE